MTDHQLNKRGDRWYCKVCHLNWKSKPRTVCAGCPVHRYHDRPAHLKTEDELMAQNLKPLGEPVATMRVMNAPYHVDLYDLNQTEVTIPDLPPISDRSERFAQMKTVCQLQRWNLKPGDAKPSGCYWGWRDSEWVYLYQKEDCEIDDPTLPTCFDRDAIPLELKTQKELEKLNLSGEGVKPRGCYRYWSKYLGWNTELLWHPDDCHWQARDQWIAKTTLRRTYLLSDRWIARLGEPDRITDNPHHEKWSEMKLYSRQRVESFLAENAEEYAQWLSERDRYLAIFEQNREAIEAGRRRAIAARRTARQAELEARLAQAESERLERRQQFELLRAEQEARWERDEPRRAQMARCLRCASGCATGAGFLCVVHPLGLEDHQLPCPDWMERVHAKPIAAVLGGEP
ncbi:hypothetical protein IQ268_09250 [Oculatella sp. LEGE 06141]|uniref:hypothetical protein n=1 Tax=Oculatella sp. LEGE 06141 TaxID=1828648 RepID=UPI0018815798|nr:hypothetical protein [Oculatella sp. LEGE 06141]MBE9178745.1 hypothetical protein [Oculatella sp. LEGE 06141]